MRDLLRAQHSAIVAAEMVAAREQFIASVQANVPLCREHYRLVLRVDDFPATEPGQFIQISCRDVNGERYQADHEIDSTTRPSAPERATGSSTSPSSTRSSATTS